MSPPTHLQRRLIDWVERAANERFYEQDQRQQFEQALADPARTTQLAIAGWMLGTWHQARGQARVLRGDQAGWEEFRIGLTLQRGSLLLRQQRGTAVPLLQLANTSALLLAFDDPGADAERMLAVLPELSESAVAAGGGWPVFVRELLLLRGGARPNVSPRLGEYVDVIAQWTGDRELLARNLAALLDRHLERTQGAPGQPAEFDQPPLWLCPLEVLAVRTVRRQLELPFPLRSSTR
jgi:hypothetical protein